MGAEISSQKTVERWLRIFSVVFIIWATVVGWGVSLVNRIFVQQSEMEHRITKLEDGQIVQDIERNHIKDEVERLRERK
jgi:hypothetical protein